MSCETANAVGMEVRQLAFSYPDGFGIHNVSLKVSGGEIVALLGPNGCGKTTLLKLMSGIYQPSAGHVLLHGQDLRRLSRTQIARRIAVVPQQFDAPFAFSVYEVVMLGRTPFIRTLRGEQQSDREEARQSMEAAGVAHLQTRNFQELSGGERQRAMLAMALAQQPDVLLLDEPTSHLDIKHQVEIMSLVRKLNRDRSVTVIAAMHDLNLASLYFNRLVLLDHGKFVADGPAEKVLTRETIGNIYGTSVQVTHHPDSKTPHVIVLPEG